MGLLKAAANAASSTMADQWMDFFYQDAMPDTVLVTKGQRRVDARSVNRGNDNIISNGSGIAVNKGQCMMIVEQGRIMDVSAEPGLYTWTQSSEPSIFTGPLNKSIIDTLRTMGRRFTHGGGTGKDQRIYYFNIRELMGNKFGTATPIPFRVVDTNIGLDMDITLRCNGVFSYRMEDPLLFYTNVSGNVAQSYTRDMIETQLRSEFISALQPAFARMSEAGMRYSSIPGHTTELSKHINNVLSEKWGRLRGLQVVNIAINSLSAPKEDEDMIKQLQRKAVMRDPGMAGAALVNAQAEAMKAAAGNQGGALAGFMGLGMAQQAGGANAQQFFAQQQAASHDPVAAPNQSGWTCTCGMVNQGRFCGDCGSQRPEDGWSCRCGTVNQGRFCSECGSPRAADDGWVCTCGVSNTGRFCSECGRQGTANS